MSRKRSHGLGSTRARGRSWNHEYRGFSKTISKADCPTRKQAEDAFAEWRKALDEKQKAELEPPPPPTTTVADLLERLIAVQNREKREGAYIVEKCVRKHLIPKLGKMDASKIEIGDIDAYRDLRMTEKTRRGTYTRNATINNEVSYLTSALRLLRPQPKIIAVKKLDTKDGVRQGLVSEDVYLKLLCALEDYQKPVWSFGYYTGVRQGQLLKLERAWGLEALETGVIETPGRIGKRRITKNGEPHFIPLYMPAMREFLKLAIETGNPDCPYLFQREGKKISRHTFYQDFVRKIKALGLDEVLFHDLRRTAVTTMIQAGIPPDEAMAVSGHKDPSVFRRYFILKKKEARENVQKAGEKMARWHGARAGKNLNLDRISTSAPEAPGQVLN